MSSKRGVFILLEGLDRSGKSTQCRLLCEKLNAMGQPAKQFRFPERTTGIGKMINGYLASGEDLDDRSVHLLFSANRWEMRSQLLKELEAGTHIVVDRYAYSGVAFSAAKGLNIDWCFQPDLGLPAPDVTMFMSLTEEEAKSRGGFGDERYETTSIQRRVRAIFNVLQASLNFHTINANQTLEKVHDDVLKAALEIIETKTQTELGLLTAPSLHDQVSAALAKVIETEKKTN